MYQVTLISKGKKYTASFNSSEEACSYARMFWHLFPQVVDPDGKPILSDGECLDSEL